MTDPRIIECAKALADYWREHGFDPSEPNEGAATVCVLKWLEQQPTKTMLEAGSDYLHAEDESTYAMMCAQAAKEIAG